MPGNVDTGTEPWRYANGAQAHMGQSPTQGREQSRGGAANAQNGDYDNESMFAEDLTADELHAHESQRMHWDVDAWLCGDLGDLPGHFWPQNTPR